MDIYKLIVEIVFNLIDITCIYCLINHATENKKKRIIHNLLYYVVLFVILTMLDFYKDNGNMGIIELIIILVISIIYMYIYKEGEVCFKIYLVTLYISILESVSFVAIVLISVIFKYNLIYIINSDYSKRFLAFIVMRFLIIIVSILLIKSKKYNHIRNTNNNKFIHLIFSLFLASIIIIVSKIEVSILRDKQFDTITILYLCIFLFFLNVIIIFFYNEYIERVEEKNTLELKVNKYKLEEKYNEEIYRMHKEMRAWRHDYRNHIQLLSQLARSNNLEEVKSYILKLDVETSDSECVIYTGNSYIDAILTTKKLLANSLKIDFTLRVSNIKEVKMDNLDICTLLANLLDNSIEACQRVKGESFMKLDIASIKNQFVIILENSCGENINYKNGIYITSKNSKNHGIGMLQIDSVVNKYGGYINRDYSNNRFKTTILLLHSKLNII